MGKKHRGQKNDTVFQFRCRKVDMDEFKKRAESEGFISVAQWLLWHLRRIIRDSQK